MTSLNSLLSLAHLLGLVLGVGAATVKLALLLRCYANPAFVPVFLKVSKPITRQIVLGLVLLTLSGIGWLVGGYVLTPRLVVKLILVAAIWVLGPIIDNVVEPKFQTRAPATGEPTSAEFIRIQMQYLTLEAMATGIFYVIILMWKLA